MTRHGDDTPNALTSLAAELASDLGETANNSLGLELIHLITRFEETGDANWVDMLIWRITQEKFALPRTVQSLAAAVAKARLQGAGTRNNVSKVLKEHIKELQFLQMAGLVGLGYTRKEAAMHAANAVHAIWGHSNKASFLEKEFPAYLERRPVGAALSEHLARAARDNPESAEALGGEFSKLKQRSPGSRR